MLDYVLIATNPLTRSESLSRCNHCGRTSLMGADGFLMSRCMKCGSWQSVHESPGDDVTKLKEKFIVWWQKLKNRFLSNKATKQSTTAEVMHENPA